MPGWPLSITRKNFLRNSRDCTKPTGRLSKSRNQDISRRPLLQPAMPLLHLLPVIHTAQEDLPLRHPAHIILDLQAEMHLLTECLPSYTLQMSRQIPQRKTPGICITMSSFLNRKSFSAFGRRQRPQKLWFQKHAPS